LSIDNHKRQRGSDEADAPLLLEGEETAGDGDVVIGGEKGDQGNDGTGDDLQKALAIETQQRARRRGRL
jgi:hypothetical protein